MGIPSYFTHIVKNYRSIIKIYENNKILIDNLYIDSNSIIYDSVINIDYKNNLDFESKLLDSIIKKLKEYIEIIKPTKKVIIAFDGVAPVAKLKQQKNRRYKSWFEQEINKSLSKEKIHNKWNTSSITPGTNFMNKLDVKLKEEFENNVLLPEIIISSSKDIGEGEHKIFNYIRNNKEYHNNTSTAIYGLDSDLIMLCLNHIEYSEKLYLFRETPYFIKNIDSTLLPNKSYILDIPDFSDKLLIEMNNNTENKDNILNTISKNDKINLIKNYVFMFFLLGNDFLPHFPALNIRTTGIDTIINAFNKLNKLICKDNKIIWKNLKELFNIISLQEKDLMIQETNKRDKLEKRLKTLDNVNNNFVNIPLLNREKEKFINPNSNGWEERYYKVIFGIELNHEWLKKITTNYLSILEWNFKYYNTGCPDWLFKYNYNYPPLIKDLINFIPYFDTNFIEDNKNIAISEYTQLAYVLPRTSLNLLPINISNKLLDNFNDFYKLDYKFEWSYCKYFWECHVIDDDIDINLLQKIINGN